jgi:hypothetical protein
MSAIRAPALRSEDEWGVAAAQDFALLPKLWEGALQLSNQTVLQRQEE